MYTNISFFLGEDQHLVDLLRVLAVRKGVKVGKLIREAVDSAYGDELDELRPIFFADISTQAHNNNRIRTNRRRHSTKS